MTLRLVTDNSDVVEVAAIALADEIRDLANNEVKATSIVTIALGEDGTEIRVLGEQMSAYALMGLFEAAKFEMLADMVGE